jgi:peptide-methionine (S)-S-oxide reductase
LSAARQYHNGRLNLFEKYAATFLRSNMTLAINNIAIFAGGCFWCMESAFDPISGVKETISGYTGGSLENPTYEQVRTGETGHYEAVKVLFDPHHITYDQLLDIFWHNIDPFDEKGQFCDKGLSYRSAIFYQDKDQKEKAQTSKSQIEDLLGQPVVTELLSASPFYSAEDHHQKYYQKNPTRKFYNYDRQQRLEQIWRSSRLVSSCAT